jgi:hypothetical protein
MQATVIAFPVQTACETCQRPCGPDQLNTCNTCGQKMCGKCDRCRCDVLAAELLERALMQPGLRRRIRRAARRSA